MQLIKEFKSIVKLSVFDIFIFVIIFGYLDYRAVVMISKIPAVMKEIFTADLPVLVLADIGFIVVTLFVAIVVAWFNAIFIHFFIRHIRLIGVSVSLLDEGIRIKGRSGQAFVPNSSITHISRSANNRHLFIVWNAVKGPMSFILSNRTFGMKAVEEADSILRARDAYVDDPKRALEIRKGISKFRGILWPKSHCDIEDGVPL